MIKVNLLVSRRGDLSRTQFRDYYETRHGPLTIANKAGLSFDRYVRNHIVETQGEGLDFDCISEFWYADEQAIANAQHFMHGPDGEPLRVDEVNFIDTSLIRYFASAEEIVAGPTRGTERPGSRKTIVLLRAPDAREGFDVLMADRGRAIADAHGAGVERVSIDLSPGDAGSTAFDTMLTVWHAPGAAPPYLAEASSWPGFRLMLVVEPSETR